MEYVFGTDNSVEILQTKSRDNTLLTGFHTFEKSFFDQTITDRFRVVRLIKEATDDEGNIYKWYLIDQHYRFTDKFSPAKPEIETGIMESQDAICELSGVLSEQIAELEDALCELTMEG